MNRIVQRVMRFVRDGLDSMVNRFGYEIVHSQMLYEWQQNPQLRPVHKDVPLPEGAERYLSPSNPALIDLQTRYAAFQSDVTTPLVWTAAHLSSEDRQYFRGDNAYVWQLRGFNMNVMSYALTTYYVKCIDKLGLLDALKEDGAFGCFTFEIEGRVVSRDLLDSIIEYYSLENQLHLSKVENLNILDIGAGYGRLAHRMVGAMPRIRRYVCTDAVAVSTFISDYYLRFRNITDKTHAAPLDTIERVLRETAVHLAVNIHSFSECRLEAIEWWVSLLARNGVRNLMIAPNALDHGGTLLQTNDRKDFGSLIEKYGYKLTAKVPKYRDPVVQQYGINPTHHHYFELSRR